MAGAGVTQASIDANARLDPYAKTGALASTTLGSMIGPDGQLMKNFGADDMRVDPGYAFRLAEGQKALERSQSARGATGGGGASKALARYSQGMAAQEYQAAFDRNRTQNTDRFSQLDTLSREGQTAATTQGGNTIGAARYAGDTGVATARYAGDLDTNAAQVAGNTNVRGAEVSGALGVDNARHVGDNDLAAGRYQGDVGINGAQYAGNVATRASEVQGGNTMNAGTFRGNAQIGAGNARADGTLGRAAAWNGMLSGIGSTANSVIAGGFGGGGGFNLGGAAKGLAPQPIVRPRT